MNIVDALVLKSLKGVGDGSLSKLLDLSKTQGIETLEDLASVGVKRLPLRRVPESLNELLGSGEYEVARLEAEKALREWGSQNVEVIYRNSDKYPKQLLSLESPPPFLFCKGNLSLLADTRAIAVVGTRNNTPRGAAIATKTVEAFHRYRFIIVSGLAIGVDSIAHRAALDCGASTVAVVVDLIKIAPASNKGLANEILENDGLLISENSPGTPTIAALFAKRERIQSGLSTAVFAIETSKDGGTMHAVKAAAKMGRPVFVPDAVAAKYNDLNIEAIQGTQYLVDKRIARAYTSESYASISQELDAISQSLAKALPDLTQEGLPL